jgi:hypothetical protein
VWRFRCTKCRKTFTRLPWFLIPHKHYAVREIEGALQHSYDGHKLTKAPWSAEESTLRRWRKEYSGKIQHWAGLLESEIYGIFRQAQSIITLSRNPLKRLKKALDRLPSLPSRWATMIKALYWLLLFHPLCLNSPPGYGIDWYQILKRGGNDTS